MARTSSRAVAIEEPVALAVIPLRQVLPWALFAGVLLLALCYLVGVEQGAVTTFQGTWMHEFVHDGRHLLGFPCH